MASALSSQMSGPDRGLTRRRSGSCPGSRRRPAAAGRPFVLRAGRPRRHQGRRRRGGARGRRPRPASRGRSGSSATTSAPRSASTARRRAYASGSVDAVGVSTQVAPTKRSRTAPSMPTCSEPAIGCPPTKRGWSTDCDQRAFHARPRRSRRWSGAGRGGEHRPTTSAATCTGVATHDQLGRVVLVPPRSIAPSATRPARRRSAPTSIPLTCQPRRRRAIPTEPPIRPVPRSSPAAPRPKGGPQSGRSSRSPWAPSR